MRKLRDKSQPLIKSKQHEFVMPPSEANHCYFHPVAKGERAPSGLRIGVQSSVAKPDDEVSSPLKEHQGKRNEERFLRQKKASKPVVSTRHKLITTLETESLQGAQLLHRRSSRHS